MTVSAYLYSHAMLSMANKEIDWNLGNVKVALCAVGYVPNQNADDYFNDVTNEVIGSTGYTAGGAAIPSPTQSTTLKVTTLSGNAVSWAASTITARIAVIYDSTTGVAATEPLMGYIDFGTDVSTTAGTFTINWNASGIATLTVA